MARPTDVRSRSRSLFLIATDVAGRVSILAGPYPTIAAAAARVRAVVERLATAPALGASATFFGRV